MKLKVISITIFVFAVLMGAGVYLYKNSSETKITEAQIPLIERDYASLYGSNDAKVTLVEFFDPACETCARFSPLVKELVKKYNGKLKVISRYAPLHQNSDFVAALLEATRAQGKFEESLELLFENQNLWVKNHISQPELAVSLLQSANVNIDKVFLDMQDEEILRRVAQDMSDMKALGIKQTPSFFVNGKALKKFGYGELVKLIDEEIRKTYK
jgi:protein-disulfide isomerase